MARIESLNILLETTGRDLLAELYGKVIENVQHDTISSLLKNMDLSGDPQSGTVEAKRFVNSKSDPYGTARAGGKANSVKSRPVSVPINVDREITEEIEEKDTRLYGVDGLLTRRSANHQKSMIRELERAFFQEAANQAIAVTPTVTEPNEIAEAMIQQIETTKNDFVDGVPRDMISLIMTPAEYGKMRNFLDTTTNNANVDTAAENFKRFHGARIFSSIYLPAGVKMICMADASVAQPVMPNPYTAQQIPLSNAYAVMLFYFYGTKAVTPDLIAKLV